MRLAMADLGAFVRHPAAIEMHRNRIVVCRWDDRGIPPSLSNHLDVTFTIDCDIKVVKWAALAADGGGTCHSLDITTSICSKELKMSPVFL